MKKCAHNDATSQNNERKGRDYFPQEEVVNKSETAYLLVDPDSFLPNEIDTSAEYNLKARNYFPSQFESSEQHRQELKKGERFYIELAIFVDRDLYRHMQENFPIGTDKHIIQVVLAMINAVSFIANT